MTATELLSDAFVEGHRIDGLVIQYYEEKMKIGEETTHTGFFGMKNLLETKFYIPTSRYSLLLRPHLVEHLNEGNTRKLTLISAPAGFGKTTLLSQWVSTIKHPVCWLSLDTNDNDPYRFIAYLIGAIQKIDPNVGQEALEILNSSKNPSYEVILGLLINEISQTSEHISLILDDYQFINDEQVHKILSFIVDYMPCSMHLVVSTRLDPPLSLARMRARRELVEIRSKDLRLTLEETAVLLNDVMGFALSMEDVKSLDERVEGWVASLHMAALSMQGTKDISSFIKTFSGSNRFILDYLMEEVLGKQTTDIKDFLLRTSIVERMNASLCNTLLKKEDSQQILIQLEQSNTFLIPLDNERIWYRYHHLFADLLQNRLMKIHPTEISNLHIRASIWYDKQGLLTEAISHALKGKDFDRVANLVEKYGFAVTSFNQEKTLSSWLQLLPVDVVCNRPWLCILQAWLHYSFGPRAKAEEFLEIAEKLIAKDPSIDKTSPAHHFSSMVDQQRIKGAIASIRAHISITEGDFQAVLEHANSSLENPTDKDPWRITAMVALGLAYWALGDRYQSEKTFEYTSAAFLQRGNWDGVVSSLGYKGIMQFKHGQLQSAFDTYTEALARATRPDGAKILFASIPSLRIGNLLREWNDLARAQDFIDSGIALAEKLNHPDVLIESYICLARLRYAFKNRKGVMDALNKAETILEKNQVDPWYLGWLDECWVSYWISMGNLPAAISQIERRDLTVDEPISYQHDLHHTNLVRVLVAQGVHDPSGPYLDQAERLLNRLQDAAEKADWVHETIKILILKGLMFWTAGEKERSVDALIRSLTLAEPGGYVRLFVDEGGPMEDLLSYIHLKGGMRKESDTKISAYVDRLLKTMRNEKQGLPSLESPKMSNLVESLSDREAEVLRFLNTQLSSTEIAQELSISANTVRFHIKNIYGKLNVNRRAGAVQRAKELGIL